MSSPAHESAPSRRRPQPPDRERVRPITGRTLRAIRPVSVGLAAIAAAAALFGVGTVAALAAGAAAGVLPRVVAAGSIAARIVIANLDVLPLTPVDRRRGQHTAARWQLETVTGSHRQPPAVAVLSLANQTPRLR
jgi:hypothetical protein